jgi:glucose/arabinose dehydrogenase
MFSHPDSIHMRLKIQPLLLASITLACSAQSPQTAGQRSPTPATQSNTLTVETVASGLVNPWGLAILADGRMLVTEKPGRVRWVGRDGKLSEPLSGVPAVAASGQGGLLDITLDPQFDRNQTIYLSYAEPGGDGTAGTAVARARVGATGLDSVRVIYHQEPKVRGGGHFGSRIVFANDGKMFVTQGDRFSQRERAQDLTVLIGKIVRINPDGSVPNDNPFVGRSDTRPEIWSYGHRNLQGAFVDPATGQLWTIEHGAAGGDELNHPEAGKNYGWPVITYGRDYTGMAIGEGTAKAGMEQPVYYWDPVIAPGGLTLYSGTRFPGWQGSILAGSLNPGGLVRLTMANGRVVAEERHLGELRERIRDVQQGPDGLIYVTTDNSSGRILRISPK